MERVHWNYIFVTRVRIIMRPCRLQMMQRCIIIGVVNDDATDLLLAATGERSVRAVAIRSGFDPSTLTRQVKSGVRAETVIHVARAYGLSPVATLVRFGFLTQAEAVETAIEGALEDATDEQLAQEILDRVRTKSASQALTGPLEHNESEGSNVSSLEHHRQYTADDFAAAASERTTDDGEDTDYY